MKSKILLIIVGFLLVGTLFSQDDFVTKKSELKEIPIKVQSALDQAAGDKTAVVALAAYVVADEGSGWTVDHLVNYNWQVMTLNITLSFLHRKTHK